MENNDRQQSIAFFNTLLEAERAGVKVLSDLILEVGEEDLKSMMKKFLADEGMNCRILSTLIMRLGGEPSKNTGNFVNKIQALENTKDRLDLLVKGQEWVARQIRKNRLSISPGSSIFFMESIKIQHEENVDAMKKLLNGG